MVAPCVGNFWTSLGVAQRPDRCVAVCTQIIGKPPAHPSPGSTDCTTTARRLGSTSLVRMAET